MLTQITTNYITFRRVCTSTSADPHFHLCEILNITYRNKNSSAPLLAEFSRNAMLVDGRCIFEYLTNLCILWTSISKSALLVQTPNGPHNHKTVKITLMSIRTVYLTRTCHDMHWTFRWCMVYTVTQNALVCAFFGVHQFNACLACLTP